MCELRRGAVGATILAAANLIVESRRKHEVQAGGNSRLGQILFRIETWNRGHSCLRNRTQVAEIICCSVSDG
jgi:hypothetical protein